MRERDIEKKYKKAIEDKGGMCLKLSSQYFSGLPDRLVILPGGDIFFVEFKSPTGILSMRQRSVIRQLKELGVRVEVINEI